MATADQQPRRTDVSRRTFLRGAGFALALPRLESLPLRAEESGKRASSGGADRPPVRFGCIYFSNGVEPIHWFAKGAGASMEIGPIDIRRVPRLSNAEVSYVVEAILHHVYGEKNPNELVSDRPG